MTDDPVGGDLAGTVHVDVLRRGIAILWQAIREEPRSFAASLAGSLVYGLMLVAQSYLLGALTTHVLTPAIRNGHTATAGLVVGALAILAVGGLKIAGIIGRRLCAGYMQFALQANYRRRVTRRYLDLPLSWHARHSTGQLLSNANSDVEAAWYPIAPMPFAVGVVLILVVVVVVLFVTNVFLAIVGCLVFPSIVATNSIYARRMSPLVSRSQQLRGEVSGLAHESFEGALVVKTLGREDSETARFAERSYELRDSLVSIGRLRGTFDPMLEAIPNIGVLLVLLVGASAVGTGTLVQVAYLFSLLAFPLRAIGWLLAELPRSVVGFERISQVLQAEGDMTYGTAVAGAGAGPATVSARGVSFAYAGHAPVLREVDLELRAGATVAIVGPTGAGKSTLTALLVRLFDPTEGVVLLDGTDLRTLAHGAVADTVALVAQTAFLFDDTVRGNVLIDGRGTDADVWSALRLAQADGFVAALPAGLDTMIGERGTTLSGGQRQRLSLARAVLRRPRLLVLDDATSAVDPSVEQAILAGLRESELPATTLVVAYRRATIALADEVLFLQAGRITDRGTHLELAARNADYARIVTAYDLDAAEADGLLPSDASGATA